VTQPEDRRKRELELRFTSDLRRLDYAALFDNTGKLQYGNVAVIPKDLPIDGAAHIVEARSLQSTDTGTEPAVFVAGRRQDGGIVLLDRSLYEVNALRQVVFEALMTGVVPAILGARERDNLQFADDPAAQNDSRDNSAHHARRSAGAVADTGQNGTT
jgi:hypothetical protein